jgi:hypothetical protein
MLNLLVIVMTSFVIYISFKMYLETQESEVDLVESKHDNRKYLVLNLPNKEEAAILLSLIREKMVLLVHYLNNKYPKDPRIDRLLLRFNPDRMSESSPTSVYTSYSVNKGEKIMFCLRQRNEEENILDLNTMVFVALHELAHIMTESIGHTQEFWENMKFLLKNSISKDLKIYQYRPYHREPKKYCGTLISDTPMRI